MLTTIIDDNLHYILLQPYQEPDNPELSLKTVGRTIKETVQELIQLLEDEVQYFY